MRVGKINDNVKSKHTLFIWYQIIHNTLIYNFRETKSGTLS